MWEHCSETFLWHELLENRFNFYGLMMSILINILNLYLCHDRCLGNYSLLALNPLKRRLSISYDLCLLRRLGYDLDVVNLDINCCYASFIRAQR